MFLVARSAKKKKMHIFFANQGAIFVGDVSSLQGTAYNSSEHLKFSSGVAYPTSIWVGIIKYNFEVS